MYPLEPLATALFICTHAFNALFLLFFLICAKMRIVNTQLTTDFLWYLLAAVVATLAVITEYLQVSGTISEPMLWALFGVATNRIMTNKEIKNIRQNMDLLPCKAAMPLDASMVARDSLSEKREE